MTTTTLEALTSDACIVRNTGARRGRTDAAVPGATPLRHLYCGRIILEAEDAPLNFVTGEKETGLIMLRGTAVIQVDGGSYTLGRYDALYAPRDVSLEIAPGPDGCDLVEVAAPVGRRHPVQFVSFASIRQDPALHFEAGGPSAKRDLNVLIGKNVLAGRIMAGVTFSAPGNWTSWPPHEHAAMLEEAYLYIDMPAPGFGVQLVYTDPRAPEIVALVREGDLVLMPKGFHPNVAAPGGAINFVWMMAAHREDVDRQYGVVNVQPEFAATPSGLDAGRSEKP
jgi:5-deoxy-glucuronate isomerase